MMKKAPRFSNDPGTILVAVVVVLRIDALKSAIFKGAKIDLYLNAALVFVLAFFVIRLLDGLWRAWFVKRQREFPVPKVLHTILLVILYLAAFFIVIKRSFVGINISAFLATSALLTAILGLALRESLTICSPVYRCILPNPLPKATGWEWGRMKGS